MQNRNINLEAGWLAHLRAEFDADYMLLLSQFLREQKALSKQIYPSGSQFFAALNNTPLEKVKVVVLGQDPYHGPNQAHGLSFSVPVGQKIPPSLINIYKELEADLGLVLPQHGNLQQWADQGVLLLNSVLSVEANKAASHQGKGWEEFTDKVIQVLNKEREHLVFLLWGAYAQRKGRVIDQERHLVLQAPHPSPLSAHRGFLGCGHFSKANSYLMRHGSPPINWQIS